MLGFDSNDAEKNRLVEGILRSFAIKDVSLDDAKVKLKQSGVLDVTEYARDVHAEMDAPVGSRPIGYSNERGYLVLNDVSVSQLRKTHR